MELAHLLLMSIEGNNINHVTVWAGVERSFTKRKKQTEKTVESKLSEL
jgi:hypothetical protein